jgi:hypothetical protein
MVPRIFLFYYELPFGIEGGREKGEWFSAFFKSLPNGIC